MKSNFTSKSTTKYTDCTKNYNVLEKSFKETFKNYTTDMKFLKPWNHFDIKNKKSYVNQWVVLLVRIKEEGTLWPRDNDLESDQWLHRDEVKWIIWVAIWEIHDSGLYKGVILQLESA